MLIFTILLGGNIVPTPRLKSQIANTTVIAADNGIRHAKVLALQPRLWIGDFDSADENMKKKYNDIPRILFPSNKDMTDGEIAVNAALERGASRLILCGAFGGEKNDHVFFHMTMAITLAGKRIPVLLTSGNEEGWPLMPGQHIFDFPRNTAFSIIAFSQLEGLSIHGAKWSLHQTTLNVGSSRALSNLVCGVLSISLRSGKGILLTYPDKKNFNTTRSSIT